MQVQVYFLNYIHKLHLQYFEYFDLYFEYLDIVYFDLYFEYLDFVYFELFHNWQLKNQYLYQIKYILHIHLQVRYKLLLLFHNYFMLLYIFFCQDFLFN